MAKASVPKRRITKTRTGKRRSHLTRKLKRSTGLWGLFNKKPSPVSEVKPKTSKSLAPKTQSTVKTSSTTKPKRSSTKKVVKD